MRRIVPENARLIPPQARRVFKGVIYDVYHWQQPMFDGTQATFEMLRRPDTVQVIGIKDDKLVMVQDEQPHRPAELTFPGGRADHPEESWLQAAQREMREETGLVFKNWRLIAVRQAQQKIEQFVVWFLATGVTEEVAQQLDGGEKITVELHPFDAIREGVFDLARPSLNYAMPLFLRYKTLDELLQASEFKGKEVD